MSNMSSHMSDLRIAHPELWTLLLALHRRSLHYLLYTDTQRDSLVFGEIPFDPSADGTLRAVENAVYDNAPLLDDYAHVRLSVDAAHFMLLPAQGTDEQQAGDMLRAMFPTDDGTPVYAPLPGGEAGICFAIAPDLLDFLRRTFNMAPVVHHLHSLCALCARQSAESIAKRMYLNFHDERMDLIAYDRDRLLMANCYDTRGSGDAVFFALNAWKLLGLDERADEIHFAGDNEVCRDVAEELRRFVSYVMPATFPADAMRLGYNATLAPLNLIALALCE